MKHNKSLMELALEAYPPHKQTQSLKSKPSHQGQRPVNGKSASASYPTKESKAKPTTMEQWLEIFPYIEQKAEEQICLSRHQKVNNLKIERELDLHGYTWQEALVEMNKFIMQCQRQGIEAVRIIHGKGNRSKVEGGVLREKVLQYLNQDKRIKKVSQAGYREGQSGACNVVIKLIETK